MKQIITVIFLLTLSVISFSAENNAGKIAFGFSVNSSPMVDISFFPANNIDLNLGLGFQYLSSLIGLGNAMIFSAQPSINFRFDRNANNISSYIKIGVLSSFFIPMPFYGLTTHFTIGGLVGYGLEYAINDSISIGGDLGVGVGIMNSQYLIMNNYIPIYTYNLLFVSINTSGIRLRFYF